ncbi:MAG TPA: type II toxin-antitoxin system VapC family toxin [Terriglobia bacterium]|nr:type II toxin-antitoxin system VapC family toxin [Terriglobia bacterium]
MITAVDSNILFDVFGADPVFGPVSADALRTALREGPLIACEVVWAEVAGLFPSVAATQEAFNRLGLEFSPLQPKAAFEAGVAWKAYRQRRGTRTRVAADFLIGAHASCQADRLLTRDRGFYRAYFKHLSILDPTQAR